MRCVGAIGAYVAIPTRHVRLTLQLTLQDLPPCAFDLFSFKMPHPPPHTPQARNADTVIVLERGQIAEMGSHAALAARDGAYSKLLGAGTGGDLAD